MILTTRISTFLANRNYTLFTTFVFFTIISILFTLPVLDGDFFWHVRTGQWIWEHKSLPSIDPFSHINRFINPGDQHVADRTAFLLKQYWLGQLALFGIWKAAGEAGMVLLRALVYAGIIGFMYWWIRREKNEIIALATIFIAGDVLRSYPNERPQLFGYLFMVLLLYILEQLIKQNKNTKYYAAGLMMLMLVWSNCHGSFILGLVVIALYFICQIATDRLSGKALAKTRAAIMSAAMLSAFINPNGFTAFKTVFELNKTYISSITEYASPLTMALNGQLINYTYFFLLIVTTAVLISRFRTIPSRHIVVIILLAALSLTALRYIPFFVLSVPLLALNLPAWKPRGKYKLLPLLILLIWLGTIDYKVALHFRAGKFFPVQAVQFLNKVKPSGNIFNHASWGGYLMCYTDYPVFADGRALDEKFTQLHNEILEGADWKRVLSHFHIETIIIPGVDEISWKTYPMVMQLHQDSDWSLIYQDDVALIFLKNTPRNRDILTRYTINKDRIPTHVSERLNWMIKNDL